MITLEEKDTIVDVSSISIGRTSRNFTAHKGKICLHRKIDNSIVYIHYTINEDNRKQISNLMNEFHPLLGFSKIDLTLIDIDGSKHELQNYSCKEMMTVNSSVASIEFEPTGRFQKIHEQYNDFVDKTTSSISKLTESGLHTSDTIHWTKLNLGNDKFLLPYVMTEDMVNEWLDNPKVKFGHAFFEPVNKFIPNINIQILYNNGKIEEYSFDRVNNKYTLNY